jgi:hypothetical protein
MLILLSLSFNISQYPFLRIRTRTTLLDPYTCLGSVVSLVNLVYLCTRNQLFPSLILILVVIGRVNRTNELIVRFN